MPYLPLYYDFMAKENSLNVFRLIAYWTVISGFVMNPRSVLPVHLLQTNQMNYECLCGNLWLLPRGDSNFPSFLSYPSISEHIMPSRVTITLVIDIMGTRPIVVWCKRALCLIGNVIHLGPDVMCCTFLVIVLWGALGACKACFFLLRSLSRRIMSWVSSITKNDWFYLGQGH